MMPARDERMVYLALGFFLTLNDDIMTVYPIFGGESIFGRWSYIFKADFRAIRF